MIKGCLGKMRVELAAPIKYQLPLDNVLLDLNPLLGHPISLRHSGKILCIACHRTTTKSFQQGYCYPCFRALARCDQCIIKPELCHFHQGTCREPSWGEQYCMRPHIIYLANSSGLKVGITRKNQIPTRWIDQGAIAALPFMEVKSRYHSGLIEVIFKSHVSDRTNWRQMLQNKVMPIDLMSKAIALKETTASELESLKSQGIDFIFCREEAPIEIHYPVLEYPLKITSLSFDKTDRVTGVLLGIKGQYLILDSGVINIRKFTGYQVEINIGGAY